MSNKAIKVIIEQSQFYDPLPAPDMSLLRERAVPPSLPIDVFGSTWGAWLEETAIQTGSSTDYVAGALLATTSSLIGHARVVRAEGTWRAPSNLWIGLVGTPSSGKSPALDPLAEIIMMLEAEEIPAYQSALARWETLKVNAELDYEKWKSEVGEAKKRGTPPPDKPISAFTPPQPFPPRIKVKDITIDRLIELAAAHPKGFSLFTDELSGWFGSFGRYGGGNKGGGADRSAWLEAYESRPYLRDRVKDGGQSVRVSRFGLSIFGTIQPDRLHHHLAGAEDDGLVPRFLWVWPDPTPPARAVNSSDQTFVLDAMRRLRQLALENDEKGDLKPIEIKLSATAADRVFEFRKQCFSDGKTVTGYMAGVVGKAPGTVLRLALALELLWWADTTAPEPTTISERAIDAAIKLYDLYFAPMARRVFGEAALPSHIRHGVALARFIMQRKCETVNSRDINRNSGIPGFKEIDVVKLAIQSLEEAGWLIPAPNRDGKRPGRQKSDWLVNPRIWEREHD